MAASRDQVAALADELASLAKGLADPEADPTAKKRQTHAVVQKLKSAITQIQDPLEACMQHTTNVCLFLVACRARQASGGLSIARGLEPAGRRAATVFQIIVSAKCRLHNDGLLTSILLVLRHRRSALAYGNRSLRSCACIWEHRYSRSGQEMRSGRSLNKSVSYCRRRGKPGTRLTWPVRLMRQLTCVGIFNEVKISEWSHNPQSFVMSTHAGTTGRSFFLVWYVGFERRTYLHCPNAEYSMHHTSCIHLQ